MSQTHHVDRTQGCFPLCLLCFPDLVRGREGSLSEVGSLELQFLTSLGRIMFLLVVKEAVVPCPHFRAAQQVVESWQTPTAVLFLRLTCGTGECWAPQMGQDELGPDSCRVTPPDTDLQEHTCSQETVTQHYVHQRDGTSTHTAACAHRPAYLRPQTCLAL